MRRAEARVDGRGTTGGSSPSRAMTKKMRGWPSWNTSSTAVIETTAPNAMIAWPQPMSRRLEGARERIGRP